MAKPVKIESKRQVEELIDSVDYVLVDCDGVCYLSRLFCTEDGVRETSSHTIVPGTPEVIKELRDRGKKVIFASNNSSKSRRSLLKKLNAMGFEATLEEVIVSCYLVAVYLKSKKFSGRAYVFGCQGLKDELDEAGIDNVGVGPDATANQKEADLVPEFKLNEGKIDAVVVGYDNEISLTKLIKTCTYASKVDAELFVATNVDETFPTSRDDVLVPGTGAFVRFVQTATAREPVTMGKPGAHYWNGVKSLYPRIDPQRTLMIGDRLNTDVAFGNANGIKNTLLVGTGVNSYDDACRAQEANYRPSHYLSSLGDLFKLE